LEVIPVLIPDLFWHPETPPLPVHWCMQGESWSWSPKSKNWIFTHYWKSLATVKWSKYGRCSQL